jgi:cysteine desulfurase / selenocysteine lyase
MNLYFDNAATSYPKPQETLDAMMDFSRNCGASAGRGAYAEARDCGDLLSTARQLLVELFNMPQPDHVLFNLNATDGLNMAIKGTVKPGGHVVYTAMEHNSVLRPLRALIEQGVITATKVECSSEGLAQAEDVIAAIRPETCLMAIVHGSNVCGSMQPIEAIGPECKKRGIPYLVDAAQTAGHVPIDMTALGIDMLAMPGHKGLLGPLGTGVLLVRPGFEMDTLREGGTGSRSEEDRQPDMWPDRHEAGSHNAIGIAGLVAGVQSILARGVENVRAHEEKLMRLFLSETEGIAGLTIYGPKDIASRVGVFAFNYEGVDPLVLGRKMDDDFGIKVRSGLHCAPFAHQTIGSYPEGTARASLGHFHDEDDIMALVDALRKI